MSYHINKKAEILKRAMEGKKILIIDPNSEYLELVNIFGDTITSINNSVSYINPFDIETGTDNNLDYRDKIISNFKIIYTLHLKFVTEHNEQKLNFEDIKEMCKNANFVITDDEIINIIQECEENLK